ncbi:MAG: glycoside hydrolase family 38 C-terminal domain-containing protein [Phycisphaerae bacterium]
MITVHLVFNAHIDPVWLWPWQSGLDALLATCRSACDRLEAHPDLHFTRGEAWAYNEIERIDPALFERIRGHVRAGRWHIATCWWIQPDCNGPSAFGLDQQIKLGKEYCLSRFGFFPRIAYNVDTFGHAATLPALMRANGQDRYIFMRPQEHEMELPARVFRWRGYPDGPEVVAFRIAGAYTIREITVEHVRASLEGLPREIRHTMCFVGLGDHGGGATERQIAWCREHRNALDGCRLVFSSPDAFFEAIAEDVGRLPLVVGELQHHSVGCYSVYRPIKVRVRRTEHKLAQAEVVHRKDPRPEADTGQRMKEAWQRVCFAHFHDIFGGSCVASAYEQVHAQIGLSYAIADEIVHRGLRRIVQMLPEDPLHRIVLFNASDSSYEGYVEHEPWFEVGGWEPHWRLLDERDDVVPNQCLLAEGLIPKDHQAFVRLLFRVNIEPGGLRLLRIDRQGDGKRVPRRVKASRKRIANDTEVEVQLAGEGEMRFAGGMRLPLPRLDLIDDPTDTWTHEVDRYGRDPCATAKWRAAQVIDAGPLMAAIQREGRIGGSEIVIEYRVYAGEPFVECRLRVHWHERHKLLKLTVPLSPHVRRRHDGIPGGELSREPDGKEYPVRDRTMLELTGGQRIGLLFPDVYALDVASDAVRLTLLRSPKMAHDYRCQQPAPRAVYADQGVHDFRFRFFCGGAVDGELLDHHALMMHRPPAIADLTRGMPPE